VMSNHHAHKIKNVGALLICPRKQADTVSRAVPSRSFLPLLMHSKYSSCSDACSRTFAGDLFRWLLPDPVTALCNGNDPEWCRYICGTEVRCIGLVIGQILIDAPERVRG
jgi:hypothetical protein